MKHAEWVHLCFDENRPSRELQAAGYPVVLKIKTQSCFDVWAAPLQRSIEEDCGEAKA
jgi:hypothetical protein